MAEIKPRYLVMVTASANNNNIINRFLMEIVGLLNTEG